MTRPLGPPARPPNRPPEPLPAGSGNGSGLPSEARQRPDLPPRGAISRDYREATAEEAGIREAQRVVKPQARQPALHCRHCFGWTPYRLGVERPVRCAFCKKPFPADQEPDKAVRAGL